jgi:hypothetical protein
LELNQTGILRNLVSASRFESPEVKYTDWQVDRLRDALRAWHDYHTEFTWKDAMEAIDLKTEVRIPWERLRQFVVGVKQPDGSRTFPIPRGDRLQAIAEFAFYENLISADEIKRYDPRLQAPQRLVEFLRGPNRPRLSIQPPVMEGEFIGLHPESDGQTSVRTLSIRRLFVDEIEQENELSAHLYILSERREYFDITDYKANGLGAERLATRELSGWAAISPEKSVFCFLQEGASGSNEIYISMVIGMPEGPTSPVSVLVFLGYEDRLYVRKGPTSAADYLAVLEDEAAERANTQLVTFRKTP